MNISIIGRLTGPKGDIAYQILSKIAPQFPAVKFNIAGGPVNLPIILMFINDIPN